MMGSHPTGPVTRTRQGGENFLITLVSAPPLAGGDEDTMKGRLDSPLVYKGGYHTNPKDKGGYDEPDPSDP
jgi:hypothetical protein